MTRFGKLIGVVGYKGAGKTTITDEAINGTWVEFARIGFADPMYAMIEAMGVPKALIRDKAAWDDPLDILCGKSIRHAMITIGTEWGRDMIGEAVWTNIAMTRANEIRLTGRHVIIDNVRFPSEFEAVKAHGGINIALVRPDIDIDLSHSSEQHIQNLQYRCDWTVWNNGTIRTAMLEMRLILHQITNLPAMC